MKRYKRRIKTQTVLPCAETAAMLFWALMASEAENEYARGLWWRQKQRLVEADMMPGQRAW